ncbi:type II toxin-antitoxin system RelE family toxin [Hydrogenivirga sp.]
MKKYGLRYHPKVKDDIKKISDNERERIKRAIETKLQTEPFLFGEPLRGTLEKLWKLRVGSYRVVFFVEEDTVHILGIWHRKESYRQENVRVIIGRLRNLL